MQMNTEMTYFRESFPILYGIQALSMQQVLTLPVRFKTRFVQF